LDRILVTKTARLAFVLKEATAFLNVCAVPTALVGRRDATAKDKIAGRRSAPVSTKQDSVNLPSVMAVSMIVRNVKTMLF